MVEVIPAIMPNNYEDLVEKARRIKGMVSYAQIDIMDGKFVPEVSWPYDKEGKSQFKSMVKNEEMLPFWEEIDYEIDLMVKNPESVVEDWIAIGARRIIVHLESTDKPHETISIIEKKLSEEGEDFSGVPCVEFVIALGAKTSISELEPFVHDVDAVQFMGIKKIGYQGEPFDGDVIGRIESLLEEHPHLIISVDGGVNFESAPKLIKVGVSRLVSGSAIFKSPDSEEVISKLKQE